jgi:CxxC-x17-CxxC domain-containing protein
MINDKNLVCHDCRKLFLFSEGEQQFFKQKGLTNLPKRCPNCRLSAKFKRNGESLDGLFEVNCATCNALTVVPFKPKEDRAVFCRACFIQNRSEKDDGLVAV